jgi:O-antigen/teichoic acid export membrane protein
LNPIKKLASQTAVYGVSSILGRFLNYLLVPLYTRFFLPEEYGVVSEFYAYTGFFFVLLTFGMETGFFRFTKDERFTKVYSSILQFLFIANILFVGLVFVFSDTFAKLLHYEGFEHYFIWFAIILACDSIGSLPFAKLRQEERAKRFAFVKLTEIGVNIGLNIFFMYLLKTAQSHPVAYFDPSIGVGYVFVANLISSVVKLLLLSDKLVPVVEGFEYHFFKVVVRYSVPIIIIGFAGIINEMLDRMLLKYLLPGTIHQNLQELGIYSACYKISIVMSLFIQAFRFAAEPFFFAQSKSENARQLYADVMNWFTLFCAGIFITVVVFLDLFGLFVGPAFRAGLSVVPILLLANMFLGMYVNLSIWYKLTDKTFLRCFGIYCWRNYHYSSPLLVDSSIWLCWSGMGNVIVLCFYGYRFISVGEKILSCALFIIAIGLLFRAVLLGLGSHISYSFWKRRCGSNRENAFIAIFVSTLNFTGTNKLLQLTKKIK